MDIYVLLIKINQVNDNVQYAMTSKSLEYIMHLFSNIYFTICTSTLPKPWIIIFSAKDCNTGLPASQYTYNTRSLIQLTILHNLWYR